MDSRSFCAIFLSIVFTVALSFMTFLLWRFGYLLLFDFFPDLGFQTDRIEEFMSIARPFGYISILIVLGLIVLGFMTERNNLQLLGSISLFLSTFGYFAASMFFLAGLGILRILYIPFLDVSPLALRMGDIIFLPYAFVVYLFSLINLDVRWAISFTLIVIGLLIFGFGTASWLLGRTKQDEIIDFWIYKYSRHPQYLGFLLWGYGVFLATANLGVIKGGYFPEPSFPWLLSDLIILGIALKEEIFMRERFGGKYEEYQHNNSFILSLPNLILILIRFPASLLIRGSYPQSKRDFVFTWGLWFDSCWDFFFVSSFRLAGSSLRVGDVVS